jgi:hypothetical protein
MSMPQVHIVAYCGDLGYGAARGAEMLSLMLGFGIVSRLVSGWICDRIGGLRTLLLGSVLQGVALLLFLPFDGCVAVRDLGAVRPVPGRHRAELRDHRARVFPAGRGRRARRHGADGTLFGMALGGWMSGKVFDLTGSYHAAFLNGRECAAAAAGIGPARPGPLPVPAVGWSQCGRPGPCRALRERMSGFDTLSVEFRHKSWFEGVDRQQETLAFLREMGVAHTWSTGRRAFRTACPRSGKRRIRATPCCACTAATPRPGTSRATTSSDRFNYDYPDDELADLVPRLERLSLTAACRRTSSSTTTWKTRASATRARSSIC